MKEFKYVFIYVLALIATISLSIIASNCSYGKLQLRTFNELNSTDYTIQQWRIYRYDIEKLYPFTGQGTEPAREES